MKEEKKKKLTNEAAKNEAEEEKNSNNKIIQYVLISLVYKYTYCVHIIYNSHWLTTNSFADVKEEYAKTE